MHIYPVFLALLLIALIIGYMVLGVRYMERLPERLWWILVVGWGVLSLACMLVITAYASNYEG